VALGRPNSQNVAVAFFSWQVPSFDRQISVRSGNGEELGGRLGDGRIRNQRFETRSFMPDDCSLSTHHAHSIGEVTESSQKLSEDAECLQNEAVPFSRDVRNRISELASSRRLLRRIVISLILI